MRSMPLSVAIAALVLAAAPAALARGTLSIETAQLTPLHLTQLAPAAARKETQRSCQAGTSRSRVHSGNATQRRSSTVACEQPPRSNLNLSGALKGAQAAAAAALGYAAR